METAQLSGRELSKAVAEKVFGISKIFTPADCASGSMYFGPSREYAYIPSGKSPRTHMIDAKPVPYFSESIEAAMQIVEKMREQGWSFACTLYEGKLPYASFCKGTVKSSRNAEADSLPTAICLAALAAIEGTNGEAG